MWMLLLFGAASTPLGAQASQPLSVSVGAASAWRPSVQLNGVLQDRALRSALASGLPLRFRFRIELWQKEGVFDRLIGAQEALWSMVQNPLEGDYSLGNGRVEHRLGSLEESEAVLQAAFASNLQPRGVGRFYYIATLEIETLSLSDLEELRRWLRGEARPAVEGRTPPGRAVERGLRRVFVRLIGLPTRRWEARTPGFVPR